MLRFLAAIPGGPVGSCSYSCSCRRRPHAQFTGAITGVVRDTSGGVLPGVTVEAASPALIEKVRSVVTDDTGQYRIVDLRPGTYSVTFTLPGFSTVRREGIELDRHLRRHGERRPEGRRPRRDDYGHRRNADRRRAERPRAADGQQGHSRGDSVLAIGRRHSGADSRDEQRRRFRRHHRRRRLGRADPRRPRERFAHVQRRPEHRVGGRRRRPVGEHG